LGRVEQAHRRGDKTHSPHRKRRGIKRESIINPLEWWGRSKVNHDHLGEKRQRGKGQRNGSDHPPWDVSHKTSRKAIVCTARGKRKRVKLKRRARLKKWSVDAKVPRKGTQKRATASGDKRISNRKTELARRYLEKKGRPDRATFQNKVSGKGEGTQDEIQS